MKQEKKTSLLSIPFLHTSDQNVEVGKLSFIAALLARLCVSDSNPESAVKPVDHFFNETAAGFCS